MTRLTIIALLFSWQAFAAGADRGVIDCKTKSPLPKNAFHAQLTLQATVYRGLSQAENTPATIILREPIMTAQSEEVGGSKAIETGRVDSITGAVNPRAKKYKNFYTTKMDPLRDKNSQSYTPLDQCSFTVYLPTSLWSHKSFSAPVVTHCDQNGGSQGMECSFQPLAN